MKNIVESIRIDEGNGKYHIGPNLTLTDNDKRNLAAISAILDDITGAISDWAEEDENKIDAREDSETMRFAHILSNISSQLIGEWSEEINVSGFGK